uniref:F-box domain-containing protein n=1 Tax=Glossina pallidipes TaxID=7398 RepID=A0A1A9ZK39_GLOPL
MSRLNIMNTLPNKFTNFPMDDDEVVLPVLPNEVWITIFTYLPFGDLQQANAVCKHWCELTRVPVLRRKSKLVITPYNLMDICKIIKCQVIFCKYLSCESVELRDLEVQENLVIVLEYLGSRIRQLKLNKSPVFSVLNDHLPELEELILTHLPRIQNGNNTISADLYKFPKLKSVHMSCANVTYYIKIHLLLNLTLVPCKNIERLSLELNSDQEDLIMYTLDMYAHSLRHVEIIVRSKPSTIVKWQEIFKKFTQLKVLKIAGNCGYKWLKVALENLPKENRLQRIDLNGCLELNDDFMKFILNKWSQSVESLDLMVCHCLTDESIKQLKLVKDKLYHLNLAYCCRVTAQGLLQGIAESTNDKMVNLNLSYITSLSEEFIFLLTERLPNLTSLNLENCRDAVTDRSVNFIFSNLRHLRHLSLNDCVRITDDGLIGTESSTSALSNLKRLETLSLRGCRNLTNRSLLKALKFQQLRKLTLGYCYKISSSGIEGLVEYCPALEELTITSCFMISDDCVLQIVLGLPRLRKLNVSNCVNLTMRSIDYVMTYCKTLRELCMNGIDALEVEQVQQKLLKQKPQILKVEL